MFNITEFTLKDMTACGSALRHIGAGASSMEDVANRTVNFLNDHFIDDSGQKACAMVRFFITVPYGQLSTDLQYHAQKLLGYKPQDDNLRCQTLLATVGVNPDWNDRHKSRYYKTLPMTPKILDENPMYMQFADIFKVVLDRNIERDAELITELEGKTYNVFYVPDAATSEYTPAKEQFVVPYQIRTVIGFLGMLPSGQIFSVVIFTRVYIPREVVNYLKTLAFNVKLAILPFDEVAIFEDSTDVQPSSQSINAIQLRSKIGSLQQLVTVQEQVVIEQSEHIEAVMVELRQQTEQLTTTNGNLEKQIEENERLRQQAAEMAILEERNRLARDLHDSVTQSLYSLTLFAEASQRLAKSGEINRANDYLTQVGDTSQQALKEMRLLVYELRPLMLEKVGLVGALQQRLDAVEGRAGVETRLLVDDQIELSPSVEEALYRIAQEALNNTLKHANASVVNIQLMIDDERVQLMIEDDGDGFDLAVDSHNGGIGLQSMHERAEKLGTRLQVNTAPANGTQIIVEFAR